VVIYGASGYTGRLVAEYLREFNLPFVAAGRDAKRSPRPSSTCPGSTTVEYEVIEVEHTVQALTELFTGAKVICNTVGPFASYGASSCRRRWLPGATTWTTTGEQTGCWHAGTPTARSSPTEGRAAGPSTALHALGQRTARSTPARLCSTSMTSYSTVSIPGTCSMASAIRWRPDRPPRTAG